MIDAIIADHDMYLCCMRDNSYFVVKKGEEVDAEDLSIGVLYELQKEKWERLKRLSEFCDIEGSTRGLTEGEIDELYKAVYDKVTGVHNDNIQED